MIVLYPLISESVINSLHSFTLLIDRIDTTFPSSVHSVGQTMENQWKTLVHDIRVGRIKKDLNIEDELRWTLNEVTEFNTL